MNVLDIPESYEALRKGEVIVAGSKFFQARSWVDVGGDFVGRVSRSDAPHCKPVNATPVCPKCGSDRQVWLNQIANKMTCHRAYCHTVIEEAAKGD